jgi:hypothetical protein
MLESKLLNDVCDDGPMFWGGEQVPSGGMDHSQALFQAANDFRLPPSEHGRYRTVYLVEHDLGRYKQWPLILDEALRLFQYGERSVLFLRFSETEVLTAFAFAAFLRRRTDFTFELIYQDAFNNGTISYCVRCQREAVEPALSSIEFALITDGRRPDAVARFAASVAAIRGIDVVDWSIAVCGPAEFGRQFDNADRRIRYIDGPVEHESRGWITRKKNLIVSTSHADNLLIAHDRYEMPEAFLEQLFEFGADFSVIVPAQADSSGAAFPDWVATGSQWTKSACAMLEHGDYSPHGYVNGGVIIGKRRVLQDTPWSDMLFWGQYEDVELSRALTANGVTPRLARHVQLRVTAMRSEYVNDFARLPNLPDNYVVPRVVGVDRSEIRVGEFSLGDTFLFDEQTTLRGMAQAGIAAPTAEFRHTAAGLVLLQRQASLHLTLPPRNNRGVYLTFYTPSYAQPPLLIVKANGTPLQLRWTDSATGVRCASARLDDALHSRRDLTLSFASDTDAVLLTAIGVSAQDGGGSKLPLGFARVNGMTAGIFREGWGEPEPWGIWTVAAQAHLELPIASLPAERDIDVGITATAFGPAPGFAQIVGIACNGIPLICVSIPSQVVPAQFSIRIPRALIRQAPMIRLTFAPAFPMTPDAAGRGPDGRLLGFGLIAMDARAA